VEEVRPAFAQLPADASIAVLAGRSHRAGRAIEQAALERGLALRTVEPDTGTRHPADQLVRGADAVLILTRDGLRIGRLMQLAERYAKPTQVVYLNRGA
jgi:hypothetical protein